MIRVVLDSNIIVSGFPAESGLLAQIIRLWADERIVVMVSQHIINEVETAWQKPYWQRRFPKYRAARAMRTLERQSRRVLIGDSAPKVASHRQDDLVIATAVNGEADYLITGDKELRTVGEYQGVKIRTPQEFLEEFELGN